MTFFDLSQADRKGSALYVTDHVGVNPFNM